jgi:hypothetical protein
MTLRAYLSYHVENDRDIVLERPEVEVLPILLHRVGPDRQCLPRQRLLVDARSSGYKMEPQTWRAISLRPYHGVVVEAALHVRGRRGGSDGGKEDQCGGGAEREVAAGEAHTIG